MESFVVTVVLRSAIPTPMLAISWHQYAADT
jgi:hypothetical protein